MAAREALARCHGGLITPEKRPAGEHQANSAAEEALFLTKFASKVLLIHRRDKLRAEAMLVDKLNNKIDEGKIEVVWDSTLEEVTGDQTKVEGVILNNKKSTEKLNIDCSGVFIAIGHQPNTKLFQEFLEMDDSGYIKIKTGSSGNSTLTSVDGVFAAGDVSDSIYRQAITSAGSGCMAALDAEKFLDK